LTPDEVMAHCKKIAAYKRPQFVEIWPSDQPFPLTRVVKVDKLEMSLLAQKKVAQLREQGQWDQKKTEQVPL
jgi:fatty-acyl-CoA synthase